MRIIIEYKNIQKKLVRNNLQVISMTDKHKENDSIFILKYGESEGTYLPLKDMLSLDIVED